MEGGPVGVDPVVGLQRTGVRHAPAFKGKRPSPGLQQKPAGLPYECAQRRLQPPLSSRPLTTQHANGAAATKRDKGTACLLLEGVQRRLQLLPQELEQQVARQQHLVVRQGVRVVLRALPVRLQGVAGGGGGAVG